MADNGTDTKKSGSMSLGEISTIRNILMGQEMSEYDRRFKELEDRIAAMNEALETQIDHAQNEANSQSNTLEKNLNSQINSLDKALSKRLEQLETKMLQTSQKDKNKIGKMLLDMGKKLMEE